MRRTVLLGAGFIGGAVARKLVSDGWETIAVDRRPVDIEGAIHIEADLFDPAAVAEIIEPGDAVIHMFHSSCPVESMSDPAAEILNNVIPYARLLEALAQAGAGMIVYSSTGGQIYGDAGDEPISEDTPERPVSAYGAAKLAMEQLTRLSTRTRGMPHAIVRIANPYGPGQELTNRHGAVPAIMKSIVAKNSFTAYGAGETVRDYIYIDDAADAVATILKAKVKNHTLNVGTGKGTSLAELIGAIEKISGEKLSVVNEPIRPSDVKYNVLDVSLIHMLTGFEPKVSLHEGLEKTWQCLKENEKS